MSRTPRDLGFHQPAEWNQHDAVWLAWPSHRELWESSLELAQREVVGLCEAIRNLDGKNAPRGEGIVLVVRSEADENEARAQLGHLSPTFVRAEYGDIWLRDTAPIFLVDEIGELGTVRFRFNGWGGKYVLPGDSDLAELIQREMGTRAEPFTMPMVLEGGAIDVDGEGTLLTTRQCLLNRNRNPNMSQKDLELALSDALGISSVLWLDEGLLNDHTDGHIDTIARFVAPGVVVCMAPSGGDDPNARVLENIARDLSRMVDAEGRRLEVVRIPSPGRVLDADGEIMPASYANFYIANSSVVVPTYGTPWDDAAVAALKPLFPQHEIFGRAARTILEGGGAFHCITQQQPTGGTE